MDLKSEISQFLAEDLISVWEYAESDDDVMTATLTLLAAHQHNWSETMVRLYVGPLKLSDDMWVNSIAYFCGCEFLNLVCDCFDEQTCLVNKVKDSYYHDLGATHNQVGDEQYLYLSQHIQSLSVQFETLT